MKDLKTLGSRGEVEAFMKQYPEFTENVQRNIHRDWLEMCRAGVMPCVKLPDEVANNPPAKEPPASEAAYRRGLSSLNNGNYDQAIKELSKAIETDPSDIFPYIERAIAYEKKGNREDALGDYRAARAITNDATTRKNMDAAIRRLGAGTRPKNR